MVILQPYTHYCSSCVWVGWTPCIDAENGWGNMYFCSPPVRHIINRDGLGQGSIIIRYGNEPSEYLSMSIGTTTKGTLGLEACIDTPNPNDDLTVSELIISLQQVPNKQQIVSACIMGVEVSESLIVGVKSEIPDGNDPPDTLGVCWLTLPKESSVHQD